MQPFLKEPLLHFLLAGTLVFVAYGWFNGGADADSKNGRVVRITAGEVNWLTETWTRQWQRPPNDQELRNLIGDYVKEKLLAREARELGLEKNDTVVRRRLAQKMEFLVQEIVQVAKPGDDELRQIYNDNRARYQTPERLSFTQIYYKTETAARRGMDEVATRRPAELGDPTLLEQRYADVDEQMVRSLFGGEFADEVFMLEPDRWHGPVASGYGFHLVRISQRLPAQPHPFDDVRPQVLAEWHRMQQAKTNEQLLAALLKKYDVVVEESIQPLIEPLMVFKNWELRSEMRDP